MNTNAKAKARQKKTPINLSNARCLLLAARGESVACAARNQYYRPVSTTKMLENKNYFLKI
jgi:hypothetical protein